MRTSATYRCDRCPKEEQTESDGQLPKGWISPLLYSIPKGDKPDQPDLCPGCAADLGRWLNDGGKTIAL